MENIKINKSITDYCTSEAKILFSIKLGLFGHFFQ